MKNMPHICTIEKASSGSALPTLSEDASLWQKTCRNLRKHMLVSDRDPRIIEYFRTTTGLLNEKRRQVDSKNHYMIHPFSDFNYVHEAIMTIVFLFCFIQFPFSFAFWRTDILKINSKNISLSIANIICIGDIILRFFTGYVEEKIKVVVLDQKKVASNYIFGPYFFCDVISCLPTDIYGYIRPESKIAYSMHYLRLFKLARFKTCLKCFDRTALFIRWNKVVLVAVRDCVIVGLILHWSTCLNYFIPRFRLLLQEDRHHQYSWIGVIRYKPPMVKYVICLFRTGGLLLGALSSQPDNFPLLAERVRSKSRTAGLPQEIAPFVQTAEEIEHVIFDGPMEELLMDCINIILGKIVTSMFAVIIICRIAERYTLETKYQARMNQLNEFMKNKKLPLAMRDRLVQYYEHRYQKKYFKEEVITGILSENLRKEVNINVCRQLVNIVNIFSDLPPNILSDVLGHLKPEVYLPNDIIIKAGTVGDCMYFLSSGTVSVHTPSGREVCHLQDGAYFGEIAIILKNTKRTTDIIAIEVCEVYRLDKKAFRR